MNKLLAIPELAQMSSVVTALEPASEGDYVAISTDPTYRDSLLKGGDLGGTDAYKSVVAGEDNANGILYVNFDMADDLIAKLAEGDQQIVDNTLPLKAFGVSGWIDGDTQHSIIKLTTD